VVSGLNSGPVDGLYWSVDAGATWQTGVAPTSTTMVFRLVKSGFDFSVATSVVLFNGGSGDTYVITGYDAQGILYFGTNTGANVPETDVCWTKQGATTILEFGNIEFADGAPPVFNAPNVYQEDSVSAEPSAGFPPDGGAANWECAQSNTTELPAENPTDDGYFNWTDFGPDTYDDVNGANWSATPGIPGRWYAVRYKSGGVWSPWSAGMQYA